MCDSGDTSEMCDSGDRTLVRCVTYYYITVSHTVAMLLSPMQWLCNATAPIGLAREVYHERITKIAENCATFSRDAGVKLYVELSTAQVYGSAGKIAAVCSFCSLLLYIYNIK